MATQAETGSTSTTASNATPSQSNSDATTPDVGIRYAFRIGWRFAQLYDNPDRATTDDPHESEDPPVHLPNLTELNVGNKAELVLQQTIVDARHLLPDWCKGEGADDLVTLENVMQGSEKCDAKKTRILSTYRKFRIELGAKDSRQGEALDLGLMLADMVMGASRAVPTGTPMPKFDKSRLLDAYDWLEDLHESFPKHAADAVKGSLQCWQQWLTSVPKQPVDESQVRASLTGQGERWRRILSGEIRAEDLLGSDDYKRAITNYLGRTARQAKAFLRHYWWAVAAVILCTAGIVVPVLLFAQSSAAAVAAVIATAAGSLGITWKTVSSTLGKVAALAEKPLWDAEVLEAITLAVFIPPTEMSDKDVASLRRDSLALAALPASRSVPAGQSPPVERALPGATTAA